MDNHSPALSSKANTALLRLFFRIAKKWRLSDDQARKLLGSPDLSVLKRWKDAAPEPVPGEVQERLICILDIYRALHTLFPNGAHADSWIQWPNKAPMFGGDSALRYMLLGNVENFHKVQNYLNAQCM